MRLRRSRGIAIGAAVLSGQAAALKTFDRAPCQSATYDYVVIGGGTAGLTIASRLASHASVAVIEAGGFYEIDNGNFSTVPGYGLSIPFLDSTPAYPRNSKMDWDYLSIPQKQAADRQIHYAQGKTLGGSSAINTMAYHRATYGALAKWAKTVDDESYTWDEFVPYYEKSATLQPINFAKRATPNATFTFDPSLFSNGPLQVSYATWVDPTITWIARAIRSIGLPQSWLGYNNGFLEGVSAYIVSTVDSNTATRSSSRTSYLEKVGLPAGLKVYYQTRATKILFSGTTANGVRVTSEDNTYTLSAKKEVILSAGAFGSPHLLMVSGVGPAATLKAQKIPIVKDLSGVGQNMWDQVFFSTLQTVNTPGGGQQIALDPAKANDQYYLQRWGPLSAFSAYIAFEKIPQVFRNGWSRATRTALQALPWDWPEVEYIAGSGAGPNGTTLGVLSAVLVAPLSRGSVTINSSDPLVPPVIDLGWFTNAGDGEVAVAALKRVRQAWTNLREISLGPEILPGATVQTDSQILDWVKSSATQIWHAGATCAMGRRSDRDAVVDSNARVYGVQGLRVVDASALPFMVPGHPQATIYAFAEKIADSILHRKK